MQDHLIETLFYSQRNILVGSQGEAVLSDFGLTRLRHEIARTQTASNQGDALRFTAPELITGLHFRPTLETDVYAFAMTILELGSGSHPFKVSVIYCYWLREYSAILSTQELKNSFAVPMSVVNGKRPVRPASLTSIPAESYDCLWSLLQAMWSQEPGERPSMTDVVKRLHNGVEPDSVGSAATV